jgi:SAM-dependent methyltransferase
MSTRTAYPTADSQELVARCAAENSPSDPRLATWFASHAKRHRRRIAYDLDLVRNLVSTDSSVLEIGAVPLLLTVPLKAVGYDLECIDLNPGRFEETIKKHDIKVHRYDIELHQGELPKRQFDLVLLNEVFEHLRVNLIETMAVVKTLLKPDGLLLLSTPNLRSLEGISNLVFRDRGYALAGEIAEEFEKLDAHGHMGHIREYAPGDVVRFLRHMGFKVNELIFRGDTRQFGRAGKLFTRAFPQFLPFVTVVAKLN